jgi:hypothetical protein
MTWICTVPLAEAGERLLKALALQQSLYPGGYAEPVHAAERPSDALGVGRD